MRAASGQAVPYLHPTCPHKGRAGLWGQVRASFFPWVYLKDDAQSSSFTSGSQAPIRTLSYFCSEQIMNWFPPTFDSAEWLPGSPLVPSVGGSGCPSECCQTGALSEIRAPLLLGCSRCFCYAKMRNIFVSEMLFSPLLKVWLRLSSTAREPAGFEPRAILLNSSKKIGQLYLLLC